MIKIKPIILCGGSGTRLWPLSDKNIPKQFVEIEGKSFLKRTVERIERISNSYDYILKPLLVVNIKYKQMMEKYFYRSEILYEETSNDTGMAVTRTCFYLKKIYKEEKIGCIFLPSDHIIENEVSFRYSIITTVNKIMCDFYHEKIYLFGIEPTYPETGFGYITNSNKFFEKPSYEFAKFLIKDGAFWNSGIFIAKLDLIVDLIFSLYPTFIKFMNHENTNEKLLSFDKAILQNCEVVNLVKTKNWEWSDIGSWDSFLKISEITEIVNQNSLLQNCENVSCLNFSNDKICLIGCEDLIVVKKDEKLLIISKKDFQINNNELKKIVETKIL